MYKNKIELWRQLSEIVKVRQDGFINQVFWYPFTVLNGTGEVCCVFSEILRNLALPSSPHLTKLPCACFS